MTTAKHRREKQQNLQNAQKSSKTRISGKKSAVRSLLNFSTPRLINGDFDRSRRGIYGQKGLPGRQFVQNKKMLEDPTKLDIFSEKFKKSAENRPPKNPQF